MEPEFWKQRWQANQIGFHQDRVNPYLVKHWPDIGLPSDAPVFVPLSGKSRDMCWLHDRGHPVLGVEVSPIAVRDFFAELGVVPACTERDPFRVCRVDRLALWCGDFFDLTANDLGGIAAVYDRASLIALPPAMRPAYAARLVAIAPPGAPVLLVTMEYPDDQMQGPPFSVTEPEVRSLYADHYRVQRLAQHDILAESPRFRARGVQSLIERVYLLRPRSAGAARA